VDEASWRANPEQHTIAEIVRHMAYWKDAVTARLGGRPWTYSEEMDWRPVAAAAQGWEEARTELAEAHGRLLEALSTLRAERLSEVAGTAWWLEGGPARIIDFALGIAHHDQYHAAQIYVLRRQYRHR